MAVLLNSRRVMEAKAFLEQITDRDIGSSNPLLEITRALYLERPIRVMISLFLGLNDLCSEQLHDAFGHGI
jgi:hypothetical protein